MKFNFSADNQKYSSKPSKPEAAIISNRIRPAFVDSIEVFIEGIQQGMS